MSDISAITTQSSATAGDAALAGIKTAVGNLNTGKAEISGQVFTGAISATNLSGTNTGDQTISDATITTTDVTTNNATSAKHGWMPKSAADATKFLNGAATPAYALVKDSDLSLSDITTNDVSSSKHGWAPKGDGTTTKFLNANGAYSTPASFAFKNGVTTRAGDTASGSQTIAHGLGVTPSFVRITASKGFGTSTNGQNSHSVGVYNGTTTSTVYFLASANSTSSASTDSTNIINIQNSAGTQVATVAVDATNITLTWTKGSSPTADTINILWEVIG